MRGVAAVLVAGAIAAGAATASAHASTYQLGPAHTGATSDPALNAPFARRWAVDLGQPTSYPVIAGGRVFVVVRNAEVYGTRIVALAAADGRVLWERPLAGTYFWAGLAYGSGRLFAVGGDGPVLALDPATGGELWARPAGGSFSSEPTYADGSVYVSSEGGALTAIDAVTGAIRWSSPTCCGFHSPPAVADGRVHLGFTCDEYAFSAATGAQLWHVNPGCSGGGGRAVVVHGARVYARETDGNPVRDAATGAVVGSFASQTAPAFWGDTAYTVIDGTLHAATVPGFAPRWRFSDGGMSIAPIVVNGTVIAGSTTGHVYALDGATGAVRWCDAVGRSIHPPDEHNVSQPVVGLGAGEGLLVVPAGGLLVAYASGGAPGCTPPSPGGPTGAPGPAPAPGPTLTLRARKVDRWIGQRTRLRGRMAGVAAVGGRRVVLEADEWPFDRFHRVSRARTDAAGRFGFVARPPRNVRLRVRAAGLRSAELTLWVDRPWLTRVRGRGSQRSRIRVTLFSAGRRDPVRRKRVHGYLLRGDVWRHVAQRRWQHRGPVRLRTTLRYPAGTLRRGQHWMLCQRERRPDPYGRPTEIERRCGARELPRALDGG